MAMTRGRRQAPKKPMAPWLIGLILAAILFVIALFVFDLLGYGDDPSVGGLGASMTVDRLH